MVSINIVTYINKKNCSYGASIKSGLSEHRVIANLICMTSNIILCSITELNE